MGCNKWSVFQKWKPRLGWTGWQIKETISANACGEEGRGRDGDLERGGEVNGREIKKGWNDRDNRKRRGREGDREKG
jgi:hypothetical protein